MSPPSSGLATCYTLVSFSPDFQPWRWRWYVPPKHWFTSGLHGAISQKMATFINYCCENLKSYNINSLSLCPEFDIMQFPKICLSIYSCEKTCLEVCKVFTLNMTVLYGVWIPGWSAAIVFLVPFSKIPEHYLILRWVGCILLRYN
jgi:hypothetical protein